MITPNIEKENPNFEINSNFIAAEKELGIASLLKKCNIRKESRKRAGESNAGRRTAFEIFQFLLLLVFEGCNLFHFLGSKKQDIACSKNTYYRFLADCHYNWRKFITLLAAKVTSYFCTLTSPHRVKAFVLDDSVIPRSRSKKAEMLSWVYDHVIHKTVRGFNLLCLGWTDGYSFIPVAFNMLASAKETRRISPIDGGIDRRTAGYKNRMEAVMQKPQAAIRLIQSALKAGIQASCVLMDTWFTNEPFIHSVLGEGLDVIGMLKDNKQQYFYKGQLMGLKRLAGFIQYTPGQSIFGSVTVSTKKYHIPVKLVFVRSRNKYNEYIVLLSTDCSLSDAEVVRIYGNRWSIECCFKACKSLLKLGREFQGLSYDMTVSSTALALTRFTLLEWIRRKCNDQKTICELFYVCCDDIQDMELSSALKHLLSIFAKGIRDGSITIDETIRIQLVAWFVSQPKFIQALFPAFLDDAQLPFIDIGAKACQ